MQSYKLCFERQPSESENLLFPADSLVSADFIKFKKEKGKLVIQKHYVNIIIERSTQV